MHRAIAVGDDRVTSILAVSDDVGGIEQLNMSQTAHRTAGGIGMQNPLAKERLMKSLLRHSGGVHLLGCAQRREVDAHLGAREAQDELLVRWILSGHVDGIDRLVHASTNADEVGQR
ncbi:MAG: hypothetical protein ACLPVF_13800 [Acidimicrobiales bacterium]